jgi:hypothetical protein
MIKQHPITGLRSQPQTLDSRMVPADKLEDNPTIKMVFDTGTPRDLTRPFEFTTKHKHRKPLYIQESSCGWYKFINERLIAETDEDCTPYKCECTPSVSPTTCAIICARIRIRNRDPKSMHTHSECTAYFYRTLLP